jgi:hypothetical protein
VPLSALFQEKTTARVQLPMFHKLARYLSQMKKSEDTCRLELPVMRGIWFEVNDLNHSAMDAPVLS